MAPASSSRAAVGVLASLCSLSCGARTPLTITDGARHDEVLASSGGAAGQGGSGIGGGAGLSGASGVGGAGGGTTVASRFVSVSSGGAHVCAVDDAGHVRCWGYGGRGQLGEGAATGYSPTPVFVKGASGAVQVTAGGEHTCALAGGAVSCWGNNEYGQIGDGSAGVSTMHTTPYDVALPEPITQLTAGGLHFGGGHTCALGASGAVYCWGANAGGQIGNGKQGFGTYVATPFHVSSVPGPALAVAAGGMHTCALLATGAVACWGYDYSGQTDGASGNEKKTLVPTVVTALPGPATSIAAGDGQSCALLASGDAWCWGEAGFGAFGKTVTPEFSPPIPAFVGGPIVAIDQGAVHGCVARATGEVECAGLDDLGEVGSGKPGPFMIHATPVIVGTSGAVAVTTGTSTTCALLGDGRLMCWGELNGPVPVEVLPLLSSVQAPCSEL